MLSRKSASSRYNPWGYPRMPSGNNFYTENDSKSNSKKSTGFKSKEYKDIRDAVDEMKSTLKTVKEAKKIKGYNIVKERVQKNFAVIESYAQSASITLNKQYLSKSINDKQGLFNCDEIVEILKLIKQSLEIKEEFEELLRKK